MAHPTKVNRFPMQFHDLACALSDHPEKKITLNCKTPEHAVALRLQFYSFRNAARKDGDIKEFPMLDSIEILLRGSDLVFQCKDYSETAKIIDAALRAAGIEPTMEQPSDE